MSTPDVVFVRKSTGMNNAAEFGRNVNVSKTGNTAFDNWRQRNAITMEPADTVFSNMSNSTVISNMSSNAPIMSDAKKPNFIRNLFSRGNTANALPQPKLMAPAIALPQSTLPIRQSYKEKYDEFMQKIKNSSGTIYYIVGIIVSFVFIIVGSVLMIKKNSRGEYNDTTYNDTTTVCESGNCYATTDGDGQIILTDGDKDPNMNDHSSYMTGMILLLFGIACACLTLILYFRKK